MNGRTFGKQARGSAKRGLWLEAVRASGRSAFGGHLAAGAVQLRNEDAQSGAIKKRISHLSALGARPRMDSGGFWDEGRTARLAGISRTCQLSCVGHSLLTNCSNSLYSTPLAKWWPADNAISQKR